MRESAAFDIKINISAISMKFYLLLLTSIFFFNSGFAQQKIAFVDSQFLLENLPSRDSLILEIGRKEKAFIRELSAMDSSFNDRISHPEPNSSNPLVRIAINNEFRKQQEAIRSREMDMDDELMRLSINCNERSLQILKQAINHVAQNSSIDLVIDESVTQFSDDSLDITNVVLTEMLKIDESSK